MASIPKLTLYAAEGCHLCETAHRQLQRARVESRFELEVVDITGDPGLERQYRERIPVVLLDGEELFTYFVHPEKLRRELAARAAQSR